MHTARGIALAFGLFALSFALHVIGGRLDQDWLFTLAVALIYVFATGFGVVAWIGAGARSGDRLTLFLGGLAAVALTVSALWAANDRSFAWWQWPLAPVLTLISSVALYGAWRLALRMRPAQARPAGRGA